MFGSTSLEVATGLVFIFLLLSLMVTAVGEIIANIINARAKCLWKGVSALLENSADADAPQTPWTIKLYSHPIIRALFPLEMQGKETKFGPKGKGPSYIPPGNFAAALLDVTGVTSAEVNVWQQTLLERLTTIPADAESAAAAQQAVKSVADEIGALLDGARLKEDLETVAAQLKAGTPAPEASESLARIAGQMAGPLLQPLQQPLLEAAKNPDPTALGRIIGLIPAVGAGAAAVSNGLRALLQRMEADPAALATAKMFAGKIAADNARQALAKLDNDELRGALQTLLDQAHGDMEKLKVNVETWFNHSMDRVQGLYKRKTVWVQVSIAAVLAVLMNVDTLVVLRHLCADPALRQRVLAQADAVDKKSPPPPPAPPADGKSIDQPIKESESVRRQLLDLGLPIGWSEATAPKSIATAGEKPPEGIVLEEYRTPPDFGALLCLNGEAWSRLGLTIEFHLFGWILTITAASLGAPFWFDLLNRIMNIRSAGKPPAK